MATTMSPEERLWETLVDEMIDEAASVSVADAEAYLTAAGFDVAAERARAEAFLASLEAGSSVVEPVEAVAQEAPASGQRVERKKRPPVPMWATTTAAVAVAAGAVAAVYVAQQPDSRTPQLPVPPVATTTPLAPPSVERAATAADLRRRAVAALDEGRVEDCLALLDDAKAKDPAGDASPEVIRLREKAARALQPKPPK